MKKTTILAISLFIAFTVYAYNTNKEIERLKYHIEILQGQTQNIFRRLGEIDTKVMRTEGAAESAQDEAIEAQKRLDQINNNLPYQWKY